MPSEFRVLNFLGFPRVHLQKPSCLLGHCLGTRLTLWYLPLIQSPVCQSYLCSFFFQSHGFPCCPGPVFTSDGTDCRRNKAKQNEGQKAGFTLVMEKRRPWEEQASSGCSWSCALSPEDISSCLCRGRAGSQGLLHCWSKGSSQEYLPRLTTCFVLRTVLILLKPS